MGRGKERKRDLSSLPIYFKKYDPQKHYFHQKTTLAAKFCTNCSSELCMFDLTEFPHTGKQ